ncbi:hypothetical protein [Streptomyces coffeae]|uniref:Uncharacterized protein n=1 Tax=Streptomyces coffeae TaxID=621382 RepID=A0ABS1NP82_9ACTN|nr:hypothetical protein [Streptomyces coffeae]MBL1101901.1 hypothetical protein [Streptomyces coffeae]
MAEQPVDPEAIPEFTGNLEQLELDVTALSTDALSVWTAGNQIDSTFKGLSAHYAAPEAEQLFATTAPVAAKADKLSGELESISKALSDYAAEARPLAEKLKRLKADAAAFKTQIAGDDDWNEDGDKTEENNARLAEVNAAFIAFRQAEQTCANKIFALFSDFRYVTDDGSHPKNAYALKEGAFDGSETPWGKPVEESLEWWELHRMGKRFLWDGFIIDGVGGFFKGLYTLFGGYGSEVAGKAWGQLGDALGGVSAYIMTPYNEILDWAFGEPEDNSDEERQKKALRDFGKGIIAYDQWGKNNYRAAGAASFNVLTFLNGVGAASNAPKIISVTGKAARAVDPATYIAKAGKYTTVKVREVMGSIRGVGNGSYVELVDGTRYRIPDRPEAVFDEVKFPPEKYVAALDDKGNPVYLSRENGALYNADGTVKTGDDLRHEWSADNRARLAAENSAVREPAGVGGRTNEAGVHPVEGAREREATTASQAPPNGGRRGPLAPPGGPGSGGFDDLGRATGDSSPTRSGDDGAGQGDTGVSAENESTPHGRHADEHPGSGDGTAERELTPAEQKRIQDEHVWKAGTGGHAETPTTGGGRDLPGSSAADNDPGSAGHPDPPGDGTVPPQRDPVPRPSFMREGDNPYGPRGSLTQEQIEEIQVYRANHEPGYFEDYYKGGDHFGDRKNLELTDESGFTPPQLTRLLDDGPLIRAKDTPAPPAPHYLDDDYIRMGADSVTNPSRLNILHEAAQDRHFAIQWDKLVENWKTEAGNTHNAHATLESGGLWGEAKGAYKEAHAQMGDLAEKFGEKAAEHHFIAEHYPDFDKQTLLGPKNGNDQFDQVWKHEDGRIVVIEAKSSTGTRLGPRTLPNGRRVSQGSREYFFDIIRMMKKRGEVGIVRDLEKALADGKLEYVVVKGERNAGAYTGLQYRRFDISKGTLP